jgi:2,3-bisphosphoglycerate-independent phosphoglycerate mutase
MITSTHGNCEAMMHTESGEPDPLPTGNPVPFHFVDDAAGGLSLAEGRSLEDVAPTILGVMGIEKPDEMTGCDLRML